MDSGPWLFRNAAVVIQEYDGFSNVSDYKLDEIPVWARIQGVLEGLMKKKELAEKVVRKVGEPLITVVVNERFINTSKFLRARVFLDVRIPLVRFVPITLKERKKYPKFYEKLPDFCYCGRMGHVVEECGDGSMTQLSASGENGSFGALLDPPGDRPMAGEEGEAV